MSIYTNLKGLIRINDSALNADSTDLIALKYDGAYTDVTSELQSDDSTTVSVLEDSADYLYIGCASYAIEGLRISLDGAGDGTGALTAEYWDGSAWTSLPSVNDGTASGGDTFAQSGDIRYSYMPGDWSKTSVNGTSAYWIRLSAANTPTTAPVVDQVSFLTPNIYTVAFDQGDLSAPEGRQRPEEKLILHRGRASSAFGPHYILGVDESIFEGLELSFSVMLDSVYNRTAIKEALTCGNPNFTYPGGIISSPLVPPFKSSWTVSGTSTKTDTSIIGGDGNTYSTPAFADSSKKTVCVEIIWSLNGVVIGRRYNEVYFAPDQVSIEESEDGVTLNCTGLIYGSIETIYGFGYPY